MPATNLKKQNVISEPTTCYSIGVTKFEKGVIFGKLSQRICPGKKCDQSNLSTPQSNFKM